MFLSSHTDYLHCWFPGTHCAAWQGTKGNAEWFCGLPLISPQPKERGGPSGLTERKGNLSTLSMPRALSCRMTGARLLRCISGTVHLGSFSKSSSVGAETHNCLLFELQLPLCVKRWSLTQRWSFSNYCILHYFYLNRNSIWFWLQCWFCTSPTHVSIWNVINSSQKSGNVLFLFCLMFLSENKRQGAIL